MTRYLLFLMGVCFCFSASSKEAVLLKINRKDNNIVNHLYLTTSDENHLVNVYIDLPGPRKFHNVTSIRSGTGIYFQKGIAIISLQSDDLDEALGGHVKLIYLKEYNLASKNIYGSINLKILKDEENNWSLFKGENEVSSVDAYPYTWGIKKLIIK